MKLPLNLDITQTTQKHFRYQGIYTPDQVRRVAESVVNVDSNIECSIALSVNYKQLAILKGDLKLIVSLECQRCRQIFSHRIYTTYCFNLLFLEKVNQIEEDCEESYELIEVKDASKIELLSIVEDEIILSLPMVPAHDNRYCRRLENKHFGEKANVKISTSPFTILSTLRIDK